MCLRRHNFYFIITKETTCPEHLLPPPPACPCVVLIGMAGAGKSTVGMALAQTLGWAFMDSDYLMEALYADRLQSVTDALSKEAFLNLEAVVLGSIRVQRTVIATGGSVVYGAEAMAHLKSIGTVVYLRLTCENITERLGDLHARGVTIKPGWTLRDLYNERCPLYEQYADIVQDCDGLRLRDVVAELQKKLKGRERHTLIQSRRQAGNSAKTVVFAMKQ